MKNAKKSSNSKLSYIIKFSMTVLTVILIGDALQQRIMLNLLSNAVKYNKPGGTVDIMLKKFPVTEQRWSMNFRSQTQELV